MSEERKKCSGKLLQYSRITGFYRPVCDWNPGKVEEFRERFKYDINSQKVQERIGYADRKNEVK